MRDRSSTGWPRIGLTERRQERWISRTSRSSSVPGVGKERALGHGPEPGRASLFNGLCELLWKDWYWLLLLMMTTGLLLVVGMWSTGCAWLGLWMACLSRAGAGQVNMTGVDGLLPALHQGRPWRGGWLLGLSEHLGYDKGEPTTQARGNARNGPTSKTVDSSGWGPLRSNLSCTVFSALLGC